MGSEVQQTENSGTKLDKKTQFMNGLTQEIRDICQELILEIFLQNFLEIFLSRVFSKQLNQDSIIDGKLQPCLIAF